MIIPAQLMNHSEREKALKEGDVEIPVGDMA